MRYLDPLYGQIDITDPQLHLFQTEALTRIRDISLSAVPPLATPSGMITSRFEHSVGVAYLAQQLSQKAEYKEIATNLYVAALFHDTGSPPFSHITERIMSEITGKSHEEFAEKAIFEEGNAAAIKAYGADPQLVLQLITGKIAPWSDLINGTIDLDNIDNSLRWGLGVGIFHHKFYEPEDLLKAFIFKDGILGLKLDSYPEIQKWELCRRLVYDVVYSDMNLGPETVLFRALQFAYENGELDETFFTLTDSQALYVLEHRSNPQTQKLILDLKHWIFYVPAASMVQSDNVSLTFKTFCLQWQERQKIADIIAQSLDIPREAVTVYAGKDRSFKKIHLPFFGEAAEEEHQPLQKLFWRIKVYLHPKYQEHKEAVQEILENIIQEN